VIHSPSSTLTLLTSAYHSYYGHHLRLCTSSAFGQASRATASVHARACTRDHCVWQSRRVVCLLSSALFAIYHTLSSSHSVFQASNLSRLLSQAVSFVSQAPSSQSTYTITLLLLLHLPRLASAHSRLGSFIRLASCLPLSSTATELRLDRLPPYWQFCTDKITT